MKKLKYNEIEKLSGGRANTLPVPGDPGIDIIVNSDNYE